MDVGVIPKFALCSDGANWFKQRCQWADNSYEPSAGTIIFFDWERDGEPDHVGIVQKCENERFIPLRAILTIPVKHKHIVLEVMIFTVTVFRHIKKLTARKGSQWYILDEND